ncbi:hypothetical protein JNUCC1_03706 [Lentibacillus sp. JNUCC-1]|nr:hypothetical protein [Lentibacillus sp. JNUCC-1]
MELPSYIEGIYEKGDMSMLSGTINQVVKQSFLYSYVLSQPFSVYVDAYPVLENNKLLEAEHISFGEHGESVRILQEKMNRLNYYNDDIDGEFGIFTEHALKKIQTDMNIKITGEADYHTLYSIVEEERQKYIEELKTMSGSVYPGIKGEDVKLVQKALKYFGYYTGEIDGLYGPLTSKAVKKAEDVHQIQLTPEVTADSIETLYNQSENQPESEPKEKEEHEQHDNVQAPVETAQAETPAEQTAKKEQPKKQPVKKLANSGNGIVQTARALIGTPYVWGGTTQADLTAAVLFNMFFRHTMLQRPERCQTCGISHLLSTIGPLVILCFLKRINQVRPIWEFILVMASLFMLEHRLV